MRTAMVLSPLDARIFLRALTAPGHPGHLLPHERNLRGKRQGLGTYVVTGEERHAAEHAVVVPDYVIVIRIGARVAWIEAKARHAIQPDGPDEILTHARRAAGGYTAAALD